MAGNYSVVISNLHEAEDLTSQTSFMLGLAYMAEEDFSKARDVFVKHLEKDFYYENEVKWYLGLSNVQLNDLENARTILNEIPDVTKKLHKKAQRLERKIDKISD